MVPLIERELRAALRRKAASARFWTALAGVLFALLHLCFRGRGSSSNGQTLFQFLMLVGCSNAVVQTAHFSLDLIARERRSQTLGLLFLTGLSGAEIFMSKLASVLFIQLSNGAALLPAFAVCFLLGGVPVSAFWAAALLIPNLTLLTLAVSLTASTLSRDEDGALLAAALLGAVVCFLGPAVFYGALWLSHGPLDRAWLMIGPVYGLQLLWTFFASGSPHLFWLNSAFTAALWAVLLGLAGWLLQRSWRKEVHGGEFFRLRKTAKARQKGPAAKWPQVSRALGSEPIVWLGLRDKRTVQLAWVGTIALSALWWGAMLLWPASWRTLLSGVLTALGMFGLVGALAMFFAAKRVSDDRRSGALELLLTTPLSVGEILEGHRAAVWTAFRPLFRFLLVVTVGIAIATLLGRPWDGLDFWIVLECWGAVACAVYLAVRSHTLSLVMWTALNSGRPLFVLRKVVCPPVFLVALGYLAYAVSAVGWPRRFPEGSPGEFAVVSLIFIGLALASAFSRYFMPMPGSARLKKEFRRIAQRPLPDPADPRFRDWDVNKPFPEGRQSLFWRASLES